MTQRVLHFIAEFLWFCILPGRRSVSSRSHYQN